MQQIDTLQAVVFDMDGVIFDSERCVQDCWGIVARHFGITDMEQTFYSCLGTNMDRTREIILEVYGKTFPFDQFLSEVSELYHSRYDGGRLPRKPGVEELLQYLTDHGKKIALASSTHSRVVVPQLREAGILHYFHQVVCGDMVSRSKPAPDIFLKACEKLGVLPRNAIAIEDSYNGIRSAYAGGLRPIMVPDMLPANNEMLSLAETVLPDLSAVISYLQADFS